MYDRLLIFLIDDDPDDQEIFSITIGKISPHLRCEFADDGVHGLERLKKGLRPHLILIDINMPRMNGVECLTEIRKMQDLSETIAYMYSTYGDKSVIDKCMAIGANGFLKKEPNPGVLREKLTHILSRLNSGDIK